MGTGAAVSEEETRVSEAGRPLRTLLTGFGPFGAVTSNPTERIVRAFAGRQVEGHTLTTRVFDVSYARAFAGMAEILTAEDVPPYDIVLMLGVAANRSFWSVETVGCNGNGSVADIDGTALPERPIRAEGPERLPVTLPVNPLVRAIEAAGLPAAASDSAGAFLCNHLLYATLFLLRGSREVTRAGFLHVPPDDEALHADWNGQTPAFRFADQVNAVEAVLAALAKGDLPTE